MLSQVLTRPRITTVAFCLLAVYFFASWEVRPLFFSNQNTYFAQGLRLAGAPGLQADWFSHTQSPHIVFTLLVAGLQRLGILTAGVHLLEVILYMGLLWALWTLSAGRGSRYGPRDLVHRFLICAALLVLLIERGPWGRVFHWGGLAEQFLFAGYLQPGEFGIAILIAVALLGIDRHRLAVVFLLVAAALHASYVIPASLLAALAAADKTYRGRRSEAVWLLVLFAFGVAPVVAYGLSFGGNPQDVATANALLARQVIPQHAWPAHWLSRGTFVEGGMMLLGTLMAWRYFRPIVAAAMTGSLLLIGFGTAFVYFTESTQVGLWFPWRASVYVYPLSLLSLLMWMPVAVDGLAARIRSPRAASLPKWTALAVGGILTAESIRELTIRNLEPDFPFAAAVSRQTSVTDQIIIPTDDFDLWNRFRLLTMRPTYVDDKSHPFRAAEVLEWKRRVDAVKEFYRLPPEARPGACRSLGATHYASWPGNPGNHPPSGDTVFSLLGCK